ncbi:MAG: hypothetical protein HWN65_04030 [Candidatus Helarchaeota archaeon]|nr:hypothetical protein [Candidatus Helarchaeota archaeon]
MEKQEKKNIIRPKQVRIYLKLALIRKVNQVILGTSLCLFVSLVIFSAISHPTLIFWPDILLTVMFWLFLGFLFAYSFTDDPVRLIKPGIPVVGNVIFIVMIYLLSMWYYFNFANILPIAYAISLILFIALCVGAGITLVANAYNLIFRFKYRKQNLSLFKAYRSGKIKTVLIIGLLLLGIPFAIMAIPGVLQIPITIEPKNYQAEIAFWGGYGRINSTIGQELNEHGATVVFCCFENVSEPGPGRTAFVNTITGYNNSYPNMSIYLSVVGYPGAFVWDGNTQNVIDYAKVLISVIQEQNLTTVKGLAFDIEGPYVHLIQDVDASPNRERHDQAMDLWYDFFNWTDFNAPEVELLAINYVESAVDVFDGDYDLHYMRRFSFLDLDTNALDEYAPMSYRCWYGGEPPYGGTTDDPLIGYLDGGPYWIYTELSLLAEALDTKFGNHDKMGIYLGITNCTCYTAASQGFDNLVRDALIAKHFGVKRITIFLLTTVIENGYSMGGVFDSYGSDFLDRFNDSINGAGSTQPFQISYKPKFNIFLTFGHVDYFCYDTYASLNSFIGIIYVCLLFVGNGVVAYYGWKRIKAKVETTKSF